MVQALKLMAGTMTTTRLPIASAMSPFPKGSAHSQGETTSAIMGQVTDASNAAVPGATVIVNNPQTGIERTAKTDEEGRFNFSQLRPSTYSVAVQAEGFEPQQNDNVISALGQRQTVPTLRCRSLVPRRASS